MCLEPPINHIQLTDCSAEDKKDHDEQFLALLTTALAPAVPGATGVKLSKPLHVTQITAVGQPLHQQSLLLLQESKALLKAYNDVTEQGGRTSSLDQLAADFRHDHESIGDMIEAGKRVGKSDIEDRLADKYNEVRGRRTMTKDEEELGGLVFDSADARDVVMDSEGWGKVAHKASRAAQKMEAVTKIE